MKRIQKILQSNLIPWISGGMVTLVFAGLIEVFIFSWNMDLKSDDQLHSIAFASNLRAKVDRELNALIHLTTGLSAYLKVGYPDLDEREIQSILSEIQSSSKLIRNVGIAVGTRLTYVSPEEGNEEAIHLDYRTKMSQWPDVKEAIKTRKGTLSGSVELVQGGTAIIYRLPVFINDRYWGLLSTVVNSDELFSGAFRDLEYENFEFAIRSGALNSSGKVIYGNPAVLSDPSAFLFDFEIPNGNWTYAVRVIRPTEPFLPFAVIRVIGWVFAFLFGVTVFVYMRAKRYLKESEEHYRLIAENASDVIWILNLDRGGFTYISPSVYELRGYTPEEAMTQSIYESLTPASADLIINDMQTTLRDFKERGITGRFYIHELQQPCKNGEIIWIETSSRYRYNKDGEIEVMGISRNITRRKETEEELLKTQSNLKMKNYELNQEKEKVNELLFNTLPRGIAQELKDYGRVEPVLYENVSIMFADFKGFTISVETMEPQVLIHQLDTVFGQFDTICSRHSLEKIKTIGDAYMCAGGVPERNNTHHLDICLAALEMRKFMIDMRELKEMVGEGDFWEVRIGIHTGSVMAGVIGTRKYSYDMWGDTVNIAARLESEGEPQYINISYDVYMEVKDYFECENRGKIDAKGKGKIDMYFLHRLKPAWCEDDEGMIANNRFWEMRQSRELHTT